MTEEKERDCQGCKHSRDVRGFERRCDHVEAPESNAMAYYAGGPPGWCPLEPKAEEQATTEQEEKPRPAEPPRMPDDELRKFVNDFVSGKIYSMAHVPEGEDPVMPFMVLKMGGGLPYTDISSVGMVYEYLDQAGPRSCNGMPGFFSHRVMHKKDWERAFKSICEEERRRENIELAEG